MKRNLISQMCREWRDNIWLVAGLAIVSLAIWFFGTTLFTLMQNYFTPLGVDTDHVYQLTIGYHRGESPNHVDVGEDERTTNYDDLREIMRRIRSNPNVEAAGLSQNGAPYDYMFAGNNIRRKKPQLDTLFYMGNTRYISPEIIDVLRPVSTTGKDLTYLRKKLEEGEMLVSYTDKAKILAKGENYRAAEELGREVCNYDTAKTRYVADVIQKIRRNAYEDHAIYGDIIYPIDERGDLQEAREVLVRVKPGCGGKFFEDYHSNPEMTQQRNVYLRDFISLAEKKTLMERKNDMKARTDVAVIVFMVIIIFLGLLGTFWFRTRQRVSEIAIRRVCGASQTDVFRRMIGEGMLLLIPATVLAAIIGWILVKNYTLMEKYDVATLFRAELVTVIVVAAGIVFSILAPAWMAIRIDPATAVKDE